MGYVKGSRAASRMKTQRGGGQVQGVRSGGAPETSGASEEMVGPWDWAHLCGGAHHPESKGWSKEEDVGQRQEELAGGEEPGGARQPGEGVSEAPEGACMLGV